MFPLAEDKRVVLKGRGREKYWVRKGASVYLSISISLYLVAVFSLVENGRIVLQEGEKAHMLTLYLYIYIYIYRYMDIDR